MWLNKIDGGGLGGGVRENKVDNLQIVWLHQFMSMKKMQHSFSVSILLCI